MTLAPTVSLWLLQTAALPDTVFARMIPAERGIFDYASGTLQIIVLLLAVAVLGALAIMLVATKRGLDSLRATVEKLYSDTRPLVQQANLVAVDAREVVAMLRTDVERVTEAASALSDQLLDAAEITERRIDEVNAVLDVVQGELEDTVLSSVAAFRGARVGARELSGALRGRRRRRHPRRELPEADDRGGANAAD